jgi:cytochrome c oxidase cbb3-type subunit 3
MRPANGLVGGFVLCLILAAAGLGAQGPPAPQGGRGGQGAGGAAAQGNRGRGGTTSFPAQQRPPGDPAVIARGNTLYGIQCRACHGPDLRGGELGGTNLLRSAVLLNDQAGELIIPVVREGRNNPGMAPMPPMTLPDDDVKAIAEYLHSITAQARGQGSPPPGPPVTLNILAGDANAGRAYFAAKCAACHSVTGDLAGIGGRVTNPTQLQNLWVGGRGGRGQAATPVTATVTLPSGLKFEGRVARMDNFYLNLILEDGTSRSFHRDGDTPKVEVRDPREAHRKLLPTYTDKDIHDVTAYLVTLK